MSRNKNVAVSQRTRRTSESDAGFLTTSADTKCMYSWWPVIYWRPVVFVTSLFWFWYLAPAAVESRALQRVIVMLVD
jgi:hypothetical protein